ncbi:hypothetical protein [Pseudofrankia saprophytica]|uniref:hypothetical protein n=1 Tax=Pseudofrankia saprophytica TaxID=298655 RepID=UPI0002EFC95C|nr:hypothetical protein [Pseudofrankia saprophytica]
MELAAKVLTPVSVAAALLTYFGYVRTTTVYSYFGVDVGTLGFGTFDYVQRSPSVVFRPAALFLLGALGWYWLYRGMDILAGRPDAARYLRYVCAVTPLLIAAGVTAAGFGALAAFVSPLPEQTRLPLKQLLPPLALGIGVLLTTFGIHLRHRWIATPATFRQADTVQRGAAVGVLILAAFWAMGSYGALQGEAIAERMTQHLSNQTTGVVVYSRDRLYLSGYGTRMDLLDQPESAYRFRYSGLRLLVRTSKSYVLLPMGWFRTSGAPVFVIPENSGIRVDYQALT